MPNKIRLPYYLCKRHIYGNEKLKRHKDNIPIPSCFQTMSRKTKRGARSVLKYVSTPSLRSDELIERKRIGIRQKKDKRCSLRLPPSWSKPKILLLFLLFISATAKAATLHPTDEMKTLEIPISQEGVTRIAVKGDRISGIYGINGEYTLEAEEDLGQVFLRPNLTHNTDAISLTLTTEGGLSQDLRLILKNISSEAIVLKKQDEFPDLKNTHSLPYNTITREEVVNLLESLKDGLIPPGYSHMAVDFKRKEGGYLLLKEFRNEKLQGLVLEIENKSMKTLHLKESAFGAHSKTIAVTLKTHHLQPGERTEVYVVRAR